MPTETLATFAASLTLVPANDEPTGQLPALLRTEMPPGDVHSNDVAGDLGVVGEVALDDGDIVGQPSSQATSLRFLPSTISRVLARMTIG